MLFDAVVVLCHSTGNSGGFGGGGGDGGDC